MTEDKRLELRRVDLWEDKPPAQLWAEFVAHLHAALDRALPADRPDAVVRLSEPPPAIQPYAAG